MIIKVKLTTNKEKRQKKEKNVAFSKGAILGTVLAHFPVSCPGCVAVSLISFFYNTSEMLQLWFVPGRSLIYFLPVLMHSFLRAGKNMHWHMMHSDWWSSFIWHNRWGNEEVDIRRATGIVEWNRPSIRNIVKRLSFNVTLTLSKASLW